MKTNQIEIENGRKQFDLLQANCTLLARQTDAELAKQVETESEMFGATDPEMIRENARNVQNKLDRQGREAFAQEYASQRHSQ